MSGVDRTITRLLLVEDDDADAILFNRMLSKCAGKYRLEICSTLASALDWLTENQCDLVLLDLSLPDAFGLDGIRKIRSQFAHIPIVMMTGLDDDKMALDALDVGAQDYLLKGDTSSRELERTLRYAIQRQLIQSENARLVTELKRAARSDALTGVLNRHAMISEFERHWVDSCLSNSPLSCIILDVDYFKKINDQLGHVIGDKVLRGIANRIRSHARPGDCVARYGGEEFCVILVDADEDVAQAWAEQVRAELADWTFQLGDQQIGVTASFGAAQRNARTTTIEQLIDAADHALLNAKETGRNRVVTSRSLKAKQGVYVTKSIINFDALTVCPVI